MVNVFKSRVLSAALLGGVSALGLMPNSAFAQDAAAQETDSADDGSIGAIIVTARKRAENVQNVPISISRSRLNRYVTGRINF